MHVDRIAPSRPPKGRTALPPGDPRHGSKNGYIYHGCRCSDCCEAHTVYHREWRHRSGRNRPQAIVAAERRAAALARDNHGTEQRYGIGCRCDDCREAARVARANRRARAAQHIPPDPRPASSPPLV